MKKLLLFLVALIFVAQNVWTQQKKTFITGQQSGGEDLQEFFIENQTYSGDGIPSDITFPNHDINYTIANITGNDYRLYSTGETWVFPHGFYLKYPSFNSDGNKIVVAARCKVAGVSQPYEVWVMDYDKTTQTTSNYQRITFTAGIGDIVENTMTSFSLANPNLIMFLETHYTSANIVKIFNIQTSTVTTTYDPALDANGLDATNPCFRGTNNDKIIVGSA